MRKPDFHRENPEQRISIVLGGVVLSIVELHVEHPKLSCRTPQAKIVRIVEQIMRIVEEF